MRRRFGKPSRRAIAVIVVLVSVILAGLVIPGGTGRTIEIVGAVLLAFAIIAEFGITHPPMDRRYPYGDEREGEESDTTDYRRGGGGLA
jgi:hypothetical protein